MLMPNKNLLSVAFVSAATVVTISVAPAQALTLNGSVGISGNGTIAETTPTDTKISFKDAQVTSVSGSFAVPTISPTLLLDFVDMKDLFLTDANDDEIYTNSAIGTFIDFGGYMINGTFASLTFDLDGGNTWLRQNFGGVSYTTFGKGLTGAFIFDGKTVATGFLNASVTKDGVSTFQMTVSAVPEPLTILGAGTAVAFGGFFKGKLSKKQKKNQEDA